MRRYGVMDKDAVSAKQENKKKFKGRKTIENMKIDAQIDLHGLTSEEARKQLTYFISECEHKGLKKVLIIHGKGIHARENYPILIKVVKSFIEQDKRLGMSGHPDNQHGGSGATWVILKNNILK